MSHQVPSGKSYVTNPHPSQHFRRILSSNHQAFWWHPYQGSYDHPWNPFRSDKLPHGPCVQTWWVMGGLWMYPSRWPRLSHTLEMECQHSTTLLRENSSYSNDTFLTFECLLSNDSEAIGFSPHTTSRNSWHCWCWHLSRLWLLQALGSVHPHQLKNSVFILLCPFC